MPKKRLLLITPMGRNTAMGRDFKFAYPTIGIPAVAAITPDDFDITIVDEVVEDINFDMDVDLVGISSMTPMAMRAYEVADRFRSKGIPVVLGGLHPSSVPDEAIQHADAVVIGEAEGTWPTLCRDFLNGKMKRFYKIDDHPSMENLPIPRRDLLDIKKYFPIQIIETSRGCPFACDFCAVSSFYGGKFRYRPIKDVEREIKMVSEQPVRKGLARFKSPYPRDAIFFADSNIIGNKAYAKELFNMLIPYKVKWQSYSTISIARDDELLKLAQKSGCVSLAIGFESVSQDNLNKMGKSFNKAADFEWQIKKIHDHGIGIMASFIFGLDSDDVSVFEKTLKFINKNKIDSSFFLISTPLPNTVLHKKLEAEGRIIDRNWDNYDCTHVVFKPKQMKPEELLDGVNWLWNRTLSHKSIWKRLIGTPQFLYFVVMNYAMKYLHKKIHPIVDTPMWMKEGYKRDAAQDNISNA